MKAQIEIMGLMIIVIMLSLLLFFGMVFLLDSGEPNRPVEREFSDLQLIVNFGPSLMESHSTCPRTTNGYYTLGEVLDFCVRGSDTCSNDESNGESNCEYFNNTLLNLLENTFIEYGLDYSINITARNNQVFFNETGSCSSSFRDGYASPFMRNIPGGRGGTFEHSYLRLKVCP